MRDFLLRLPLAAKCAAIVAGLCLICSLAVVATASRANSILLQQFAQLFATEWVEQMAQQSRTALLNNDRVSLQALLQRHSDNPLVLYSAIVDPEQHVLVEAGSAAPDGQRYSSDISLGGDTAGQVQIQIDRELLSNEVQLLAWQLFLLAAVMTGLAGALSYSAGNRVEQWLNSARATLLQPLADNKASGYPGADAFGELLDTIQNPPSPNVVAETTTAEWVIVQVRWQAYARLSQQWGQTELDQRLAESYLRTELVARLYQGSMEVHHSDGATLCFAETEGADSAILRALCCAQLLQQLDSELGAQARIGLLRKRGNRWQLSASAAGLAHTLHDLPERSGAIQLQLPTELREQLGQWAELEGNGVTAIAAPYRQLLDKQFERLQQVSC